MPTLLFPAYSDNPGAMDLLADTIKAILVTDTFSGLPVTELKVCRTLADLRAYGGETEGPGYTQGGLELTGKAYQADPWGSMVKYFSAQPPTWELDGVPVGGYALYRDTGDPTTSTLIVMHDRHWEEVMTGPYTPLFDRGVILAVWD